MLPLASNSRSKNIRKVKDCWQCIVFAFVAPAVFYCERTYVRTYVISLASFSCHDFHRPVICVRCFFLIMLNVFLSHRHELIGLWNLRYSLSWRVITESKNIKKAKQNDDSIPNSTWGKVWLATLRCSPRSHIKTTMAQRSSINLLIIVWVKRRSTSQPKFFRNTYPIFLYNRFFVVLVIVSCLSCQWPSHARLCHCHGPIHMSTETCFRSHFVSIANLFSGTQTNVV